MTSETLNLHVSKNLHISKTKQDIEKLKTPLRLAWKCCSVVFKIGSNIFSLQWHFKRKIRQNQHDSCRLVMLYRAKNATDLFQVANFTGLLQLVINDRTSHSQTIIDGTEK